jgi:phosphomannomutase / phosphoglucomutase
MSIASGIFRQYDIRGVVGEDLTVEAADAIGRGFAAILAQQGRSGPVVVGRDNRPSGAALRDALVRGLTESGRDVIDIGVVPTPTVYWALHHLPSAGGIQITGSHNPPEFNGFKMCVGTTSLHGDGIQGLRTIIDSAAYPVGQGEVQRQDILDAYVDDLVAKTGPLARPLRIVYDCGNGVGAVAAPQLFDRLGVTSSALFAVSDGTFPNHHPDPTVVENLQDLIAKVREDGAEIGIGFDGDADRIGIVDGQGTIIWGDYLLIIYARDVLRRLGPSQSIIFDVKCSQALPDAVTAAGGVPVMWKTGHSLIKDEMKRRGAPLAGEMSGHMFFSEGFYGHDDALYAAARLLRILADSGQTVRELLADVPHFVSTPELRVDCPDDRKFPIVARAVEHFRERYAVNDIDGVRILFGDGWGLIRASNTQPVLVMRFEAPSPERLLIMRTEVESWLRAQGIEV